MSLFFAFVLLIIVSCNLFSCNSDKDNDGVPDDKDKCPTVAAETKSGCPERGRDIRSIHFYIETSASMGGYFQKSTEFKTIISDLTLFAPASVHAC